MSVYYTGKSSGVWIALTRPLTHERFNAVMEFHGCPVRAEAYSCKDACMLAAFDWLASQRVKDEHAA